MMVKLIVVTLFQRIPCAAQPWPIIKVLSVLTALFSVTAAQANGILFVMTNQSTLQVSGQAKPTGIWLSEFTKPYYLLSDAGFDITLATPQGGRPPIDPRSLDPRDPKAEQFNERFENDDALQQLFANTKPLADIKANQHLAVVFPGGHGPMFDLVDNPYAQNIVRLIYESGGVVGALCHGPAALVNVKLSDGTYLITGKLVTGFTNAEEKAVKLDEAMPFLLESKLRDRGAKFIASQTNFNPKVVSDDRLITGQNPASAIAFGKQLKATLRQSNASAPPR